MNFKDFYYENIENYSDTFQVYHGGKKWYYKPTDLLPSKKNRKNYGTGIYTTNFLNTARNYAKGSRVVHLLEIDKNYRDIRYAKIDISEAIDFIKNLNGLRKKGELINQLKYYSERIGKTEIGLSILSNIINNNDAAPGLLGKEVSDFLVSKGADGEYISQSGNEFWFLIFNPKIIKRFSIVDPKKEGKEFPFELPDIKNPLN